MNGPLIDARAVARALGGNVAGRNQVSAPGPGHSARDRSLSIKLDPAAPEGFLVHSFANNAFDVCRRYVAERLGLDPNGWRTKRMSAEQREQPPRPAPTAGNDVERERARGIAKRIVSEIVPIVGTSGETYLRDVRNIDVNMIRDVLERTDAIGWHPRCLFLQEGHALHGKRCGAIIAIMSDAATGKPTGGISRTYVHEGQKVGKAKGLGPAGVVRLSRDEDVLGGLFLAEGLETALTGMSIGLRPMWSTGSTSIMAKLPIVAGIECVSVLADNDANGAGERAARELANRWIAAGREARVWLPQSPGDLNDILTGRT